MGLTTATCLRTLPTTAASELGAAVTDGHLGVHIGPLPLEAAKLGAENWVQSLALQEGGIFLLRKCPRGLG